MIDNIVPLSTITHVPFADGTHCFDMIVAIMPNQGFVALETEQM
jgi:hypothetical protein